MGKTKAELEAEIQDLRRQLGEARTDYERACKTIEDIAAAVGGVTGAGIVEDVADLRRKYLELKPRHAEDSTTDEVPNPGRGDDGEAYRRGRADAARDAVAEVVRLTGRTGGVLTRAVGAVGE
ncbi:hypothetical protein [Actinomadura nitritigenes]|uniref:hypothetical protein n=1 Tax=Actinomadura nitritigenes TaxID=134602 RepID=UPI003D9097E7